MLLEGHRVRQALCKVRVVELSATRVGLCNYGGLIDTLFTDVEGVA